MKNLFQFLYNGVVILFFLAISGCQQKPNAPSIDLKLPTFKNMVVLGDSYSDNGNVYRLTNGYYPGEAYYEGRFSDGPVWSEYFAQSLQIDPSNSTQFLDFAYGQAQISGPYKIEILKNDGKKVSYSIPDLNEQITSYLKKPVEHPEKTLFVVFIGTNDLLNLADTENHQELIEKLLSQLQMQLDRLESNGASHILVVNMRNLTLTPYICSASQKKDAHPQLTPQAYIENYVRLIESYNSQLLQLLQNKKNILKFDAYNFDTKIHEKIVAGGYPYQFDGKYYVLKYGGDKCYLDHAHVSCYINKGNYQKQVSPICPDPTDYFYYDRAHPTTYVHKLMAEAVYEEFCAHFQK